MRMVRGSALHVSAVLEFGVSGWLLTASHCFWEVVQADSNSTLGIADAPSHGNCLCACTWERVSQLPRLELWVWSVWQSSPEVPHYSFSAVGTWKKEILERAVRFLVFVGRGEKINTVTCYLGKLSCKTDSVDMLERTGGICCNPLCCVEGAGSAEAKIIRENNSFIQGRDCNDTYYCAILPAPCFSSRRI